MMVELNSLQKNLTFEGICDCCDGSDEKGSKRALDCPNTCNSQLDAHIQKVLKEAG